MAKKNIIPNKIPVHFREKQSSGDVILYALGLYGPMKREEFINNKDVGINDRMDKNTFHSWAKKLKKRNYINVFRDGRYSVYTITNLGINKLIRCLKSSNLDMKTILDLEQKAVSQRITQITPFFKARGIQNENIIITFLKLKNELSSDSFQSFSEEKLNKSILFLTLNNPRFYDNLGSINISINDFIQENNSDNLSKDDLKWFLQKIVKNKINNISFYKLKLSNNNISLFFRSTEVYGSIFEIIFLFF